MGDSSKREDSSKIGKFDSGLKYALAILNRHDIEITIDSNGVSYSFETFIQRDDKTTKTKEVIQIVQTQDENTIRTPTAFAVNMGHEWKLWMAIRELYSNCIDENGLVMYEEPDESFDTVIRLKGNDALQAIIDGWESFFIDKKIPICKLSGVSIYENNEDYLKIYKNGILVYKDEKKSSHYSYDHPGASIDEMRVLNNFYDTKSSIEYAICNCSDEDFIQKLYESEYEEEFETNLNLSDRLSNAWVDFVNNKYIQDGNVETHDSLIDNFMEDRRIDIGVKKVASRNVNYSEQKVIVKTEEKREEVILSFEDEIKNICKESGFDIQLPVILSEISGMSCIADMHKQVIYVTKEFTKDNVWEIIKAHYRIHSKDDVDLIFKDHHKLLNSN